MASQPAMMATFNPKNQTFLIAGPDGVVNIPISMSVIDAQRIRLANICISWGVQLGLTLMTFIILLFLIPPRKLKNALTQVHLWSLVTGFVRLTLLVQYFPGPLAEYYVAWTRDPRALTRPDYYTHMMANSFVVIQFAFIEVALIIQSWSIVKTWPNVWQWIVKAISILLATATIAMKSFWVYRLTSALKERTLPVPLDDVGDAAIVLGAVSIFYFCGIFFFNLTVHLFMTRGILKRPGGGLTSLEILAVGNGALIILSSIFAALDLASGLSGTKVLPFDAGSWVQTLLVVGLPLTSLIARYTGQSSDVQCRRVSFFANGPILEIKTGETSLRSPMGRSFAATIEADDEDLRDDVRYRSAREGDLEAGIHIKPDFR